MKRGEYFSTYFFNHKLCVVYLTTQYNGKKLFGNYTLKVRFFLRKAHLRSEIRIYPESDRVSTNQGRSPFSVNRHWNLGGGNKKGNQLYIADSLGI